MMIAEVNSATLPTYFPPAGQFGTISSFVSLGMSLVLIGAALLCLVMLLSAAFKWMTADGDPKKISASQTTMFYTGIGLVAILAGWVVVKLLNQIFGLGIPL